MAGSKHLRQKDLDKCVHCGLCLNACPTYRELGIEMDSPRGRVYQMAQVSAGERGMGESYLEHMGLCLACRGCETACPSGVQYGRLIEAARAEIQESVPKTATVRLLQWLVFRKLLPSRVLLRAMGAGLALYQKSGLQALVRGSGLLKAMGAMGRAEALAPEAETPTFFTSYGKVFPAAGERRYRVALLGGCMANVFFARLNEATVRVLQKNGCEVAVPDEQTCCGALHAHQGLKAEAQALARRNIDALVDGGYDAVLTNAAGCGSTLKEYHELLEGDPAYEEKARRFVGKMRDVTEFLASIGLVEGLRELPYRVTYQDSCHLAHGQRVRAQPRKLLRSIPGLKLVEMPASDVCCGSAGIYNVVQNEMSMRILETKMGNVNVVNPDVIATANPGCMIQLRAGAARHGKGQPVKHVVELLDEAYSS